MKYKDWNLADCWNIQDRNNDPNLSAPMMVKGKMIEDIKKCRELIKMDMASFQGNLNEHFIDIINKRFGDLKC